MMKPLVSIALLYLSFCTPVFAKAIYSPNSETATQGFNDTRDAANDIINEIIRVVGLKPNFQVKAADIPNAAAVTYQGIRYILYNPEFFSKLNAEAGNNWASVSVLAHEIGHHLNGHTMENIGSNPQNELEADEFSGFVLRRMGATLEQAQVAMKIGADYNSSRTHPGKEARLLAIADGWQNADAQITGKKNVARVSAKVPEVKNVQENDSRQEQLTENQIIGDVEFRNDQEGTYYLTRKLNLVKLANNQLYLVGKLSSLNDSNFPYMIHDDNKNILLVDTRGNIYSKSGNTVGSLTVRK